MTTAIENMSVEELQSHQAQILAQHEAYEKRIAELRKVERDSDLQTVLKLVGKHQFTAKDVPLHSPGGKAGKPKGEGTPALAVPKYKNPETGETWSGKGRTPAWLEGKNKDDFLVQKEPA